MGTLLDRLRVTRRGRGEVLATTSWPAAVMTVVFAYFVAAASRYSVFAVTDPLLYLMVIGVLGWGFVTASIRLTSGARGRAVAGWRSSARLAAQSHLQLGTAAAAVCASPSARSPLAAGALWFPAAVIGAAAHASSTTWVQAAVSGVAIATLQGATTGLAVVRLVGHLIGATNWRARRGGGTSGALRSRRSRPAFRTAPEPGRRRRRR